MSQIWQLGQRVILFWLLINLVHILLTKLFGEKYNFFLSRNGIFVKFVQIQWHTKRFNSILNYRIDRSSSSLLAAWFTCGVYFGLFSMFASILILIYTFVSSFVEGSQDSQVITPVVPGVNLPNSQVVPYLCTLLLSGVYHEFGHALAAAKEGVTMYGSGVFLFLIYPAAFVDLNTETLKQCDAFQRLRIFCAGVWHNCILMVAAFVLWKFLPVILFCLGFIKETAVVVTAVQSGSALDGLVAPGYKIYFIDECVVHDKQSWGTCIHTVMNTPPRSFCIPDALFDKLKPKKDCCQEGVISNRNICFQAAPDKQCLPARQVAENPLCTGSCDAGRCVTPDPNEGYLVQVHHTHDTSLFIGDPAHLYVTIDVSDFSSKLLWSELPNHLEMFLIYIVSLSGALAIFNSVPGFYLDGEHMLNAFLELVFGSDVEKEQLRQKIGFIVKVFSTILIGVNVVYAFISVCIMY